MKLSIGEDNPAVDIWRVRAFDGAFAVAGAAASHDERHASRDWISFVAAAAIRQMAAALTGVAPFAFKLRQVARHVHIDQHGWLPALSLALLSVGCASAPVAVARQPVADNVVVLQDIGTISLAIDPDRGGAIISAVAIDGDSRSPQLVDNTSPTGRQWQAAFWNGPCSLVSDTALCAGTPNCLNPTLAGNACGLYSGGVVTARTSSAVTIESRPLDFSGTLQRPLKVVTTIAIIGLGLVRLDYVITNESAQPFGADAWQTIPVLFTPSEFSTLTGACAMACETVTDEAWRRGSGEWVARSNADGWTVLVYVPGLHPWSVGQPGPQSPNAGWMQPLQWLELQPGETGRATAWIAVGRSLGMAVNRLGAIT